MQNGSQLKKSLASRCKQMLRKAKTAIQSKTERRIVSRASSMVEENRMSGSTQVPDFPQQLPHQQLVQQLPDQQLPYQPNRPTDQQLLSQKSAHSKPVQPSGSISSAAIISVAATSARHAPPLEPYAYVMASHAGICNNNDPPQQGAIASHAPDVATEDTAAAELVHQMLPETQPSIDRYDMSHLDLSECCSCMNVCALSKAATWKKLNWNLRGTTARCLSGLSTGDVPHYGRMFCAATCCCVSLDHVTMQDRQAPCFDEMAT